jgi:N-hydroxyarylamine O-acetyltransferase
MIFLMHVESYLSRIGYESQPVADFETLKKLHLSHLYTVPFENLDIHVGRNMSLSVNSLYAKIVGQRRGGICYELNGLFAWLLKSVGFDVTMLAANVYVGNMEWTPDFDHMALAVRINEKLYLADVGFGDSFRVPLDLTTGDFQSDGSATYKISLSDGFHTVSKAAGAAPDFLLQPSFRFKMIPHSIEDFSERSNFHQHSPDTHFRRKILCSRADAEGRVTLSGNELIITRANERMVTELDTSEKIKAALYEHFGVVQ